jgi:hypothetical protein
MAMFNDAGKFLARATNMSLLEMALQVVAVCITVQVCDATKAS